MPSATRHRSSSRGSRSPAPTSASTAGSNGAALHYSVVVVSRASNIDRFDHFLAQDAAAGATDLRHRGPRLPPVRAGRRRVGAAAARARREGHRGSRRHPLRLRGGGGVRTGSRTTAPVFVLPTYVTLPKRPPALRRAERRRVLRRVPRRARRAERGCRGQARRRRHAAALGGHAGADAGVDRRQPDAPRARPPATARRGRRLRSRPVPSASPPRASTCIRFASARGSS